MGTKCDAQNAERLRYMEAIKRQIYVLRDVLKDEIVYSLGTDLVPIEYHIMDFTVPATATAVVYVLKPSGELDKILADVLDNVVSFAPARDFFEEGRNTIQIRIVNNNKALVSFTETVTAIASIEFDDMMEAQQETLIEQVLTKIGEYTGTVQTEIADRKAAVTKEETDRKKEDEAIREKIAEEQVKNDENLNDIKKIINAKCASTTMGGYGREWLITNEWQPTGNYNGLEGDDEHYKGVRGRDGYIEIKTSGVYLIALQASIQKKTYLGSGTVWSKVTRDEVDLGGDHHFLPDGTYYDTLNFVTYNYLPAGAKLKAYLSVDSSLTDVWSQGEEYLNIIKLS